ncbi:hypothetical protein SDC9_46865 [bioreactor metagenome]|uniref:Uncharacterized protein n=1 Tax=bioreactor metagenome TaxID=1076179 RepID=A0A644WAV0_9ZZZZ
MLEPLFKAVRDQLKTQVPGLEYIDLDIGQLEQQDENYVVLTPCALIDFNAPEWINTTNRLYVCDVQVSVRIAFRIYEDINSLTPDEVSEAAFDKLRLQEDVYKALSGFWGTFFNSLTLKSGPQQERRDDGYKVYEYVFVTNVRNSLAVPTYTPVSDVTPVIERPADTDTTPHTDIGDADPPDDPLDPPRLP